MKWFVNVSGQTSGPLDEETVRAMARGDRLRGAQVRDEAGGQWVPAERSPFGALMRARGWTGPIVAALATWAAVKLLAYAIVSGSGAPDVNVASSLLATIGAGAAFVAIAALRRF